MNLLSPPVITPKYSLYHGDSCEVIKAIPDNSIHFSVFSPPFASLYTYSNSERDLGNCKTHEEFMTGFGFLATDLHRVMIPGRIVAIHCMEIPLMKERDGVIGYRDFSGDIIRLFESCGFIMHGPRLTIWKDPLIEATRTKALGLMHKQICKDSAMCRTGSPDYLLTMRKPGENPEPIARPDGFTEFIGEDEPKYPKKKPTMRSIHFEHYAGKISEDPTYSHNVWRRYASPVWMDVNQTRTLQYRTAREENDERHICPLQLDVIERAIHLWSNPGDIVFSPFGGIGSEPYSAIKLGRRAVAIELKKSYYDVMVKNCERAVEEFGVMDLVDLMAQEVAEQ